MSLLHPLLAALVNDAAVFAPASVPIAAALADHRGAAAGGLVGRFLCPASRAAELLGALDDVARLPVGVVADTGVAGLAPALALLAADPRSDVEVVEIAVERDGDRPGSLGARTAELLAGLPPLMTFLELPFDSGWHVRVWPGYPWQDAVARIAAAGRGAKLRTGGSVPAMVPTPEQLAEFIVACVAQDVPFLCTSGLHRAVRRPDPDLGVAVHGFLNIALAAHVAVLGGDAGAVAGVLREEDPAQLLAALAHVTAHDGHRTRAVFAGVGSCDIAGPTGDLVGLGLL